MAAAVLYSTTIPLPSSMPRAKPLLEGFDDAKLENLLREALVARGTFSEAGLRAFYYNPAVDGGKFLSPREMELLAFHPRFPIFAPYALLPEWVLKIVSDRAYFDRTAYLNRLRVQKCRQEKKNKQEPATELPAVLSIAPETAARGTVVMTDSHSSTSDAIKENHSSFRNVPLPRNRKLVEQRQIAAATNSYSRCRSEITPTNLVDGDRRKKQRRTAV